MPKNPHAVALGRKGGKKTGRKGFAAMTREEGDRIRALAAVARKLRTICDSMAGEFIDVTSHSDPKVTPRKPKFQRVEPHIENDLWEGDGG